MSKEIFDDYKVMLNQYAIIHLQIPIVKNDKGEFKFLSDDISSELFVLAGFFPPEYAVDAFKDFELSGVDKEGIWNIEALLSFQRGESDPEFGKYEPDYMLIEHVEYCFICELNEAEGEQNNNTEP